VLRQVYGDLLQGVGAEYARLYDNHRHTMHLLRDAGLPIPEPLKQAAETVLGTRFEAEIAKQRRSRDPTRYKRALEMAEDARKRGLSLQRPTAHRVFGEVLCDLIAAIDADASPERVRQALDFLTLARQLDIDAVNPRAQDLVFEIVDERPAAAPLLQPLATALGFGDLAARDRSALLDQASV
jgi:hypothetical protein